MVAYLSPKQSLKKLKIKNVVKVIKVEIAAQGAAITPPLGPVLGQHGMNTVEFCKEFNEETKHIQKETIIPVIINLASDKMFYFELKTPGVAYFIKKYIESLELVKKNEVYILDKKEFLKFLYNISILKLNLYDNVKVTSLDLQVSSIYIKNYMRSIIGTVRSFNIKLQDNK